MASTIRQTGLLPAGCQPWNLNMISNCGLNFAYCATLAVYIYEYDMKYGEYKLSSINATHSKTITCISWNKYNSHLFVTGGCDQKICVWDVKQKKCIITYDKLNYTPICVGWVPGKNHSNVVAFCGKRGNVMLWNIDDQTTSQVDYTNGFDYDVTLFQWHHTDPAKFIFGHTDGSLSLFISGKRNKHLLRGTGESTPKDADPMVAAIWDPLSSDYLLVARKQSGIQLIDVKIGNVINHFIMPSKMVSTLTLSWVDSAPGMFLTGDHESGVLRLWNVSQCQPIESINLKSTGFQCLRVLDTVQRDVGNNDNKEITKGSTTHVPSHDDSSSRVKSSPYAIPPARVICAFADGGIGLYSLRQKKWEFLREQGHIETIFDCKFKPSDPKVLATASFDGTVKVWSVSDLTPLQTTSGNEGVIYSIAWAPGNLNYIACATRRRGVFVWDIDMSKIVRRFKEHGMHAVFCVAWNHKKDLHQLASCSEDGTCVIRSLDGDEIAKLLHPASAFGCDWNPIDKDLLATGCNDGVVRVWTVVGGNNNKTHRTLAGHTDKVFHVKWHPLLRGVLCSGSDDSTVRVWDLESGTCTATLEGHTSSVRGLAWNYEIAPLLASGSWDSTLKLWDVRSGKCIETLLDHGADIYGLATHPLNPFTMATSSRDSTLRLWSLAPMTKVLFLKILAGMDPADVIASPESSMQAGAPMRLSGNMSAQLLSQLQERKNQETVKLRWFSELFCSSRRLENLWDLVCIVRGQRESSLSISYKKGILHMKHLTKYKASEAQETEHLLTLKSGAGSRHRDQSLMRVADLHLRLGNMRRHCEILAQLGKWERAISLAPSVSISFWSELSKRYADSLSSNNNDASVAFMVATGSVKEAVQFMMLHNEYQDALLVAQSFQEGNSPRAISDVAANGDSDDTSDDACSRLATRCCVELAERHYYNADPYNAASLYLAHDDAHNAMDILVKSNKLALALCLARNLKGEFQGAVEAAKMLAWKCESEGEYKVAIQILRQFVPSSSDKDTWTPIHGVCARYQGCDAEKDDLHKEAGFPSPSRCRELAVEQQRAGSYLKASQFHLLSDSPQPGLESGLGLLFKKLIDDVDWTVDDVMSQHSALFCVRTDILKIRSNKKLRAKLLSLTSYIGALLAYRRDYDVMVKPMFQYAISLCKIARSFDEDFPLHPNDIQDEMNSLDAPRSADVGEAGTRMQHRAGVEPLRCMRGSVVSNASDLPSHSDNHVSTVTKKNIFGSNHLLDDGRSVLSLNEALMWARCNPFSPTTSGERICPF